jgi:hypothetical protein
LLGLEQFERDGIGVVGLEQLLAFALKPPQSALLYATLALGIVAELRQLLIQEGP